jgi:two-component system NarL family sensor kinase
MGTAMTERVQGAEPLAAARGSTARRPPSLDRILNRSIVYGTLTGGIVLTYAASVVVLRALLPGETPYAVALLSTGAGALVALPLRDRLQRIVNRLMYGDRDDPYRAIARLGEQLETSIGSEDVLEVIVDTVAQALRLPYAAIELADASDGPLAAVHGTRPPDSATLLRLPLVYRGDAFGHLILAPRSPGETFGDADLRLLGDLARQAGPAVQAVRLTGDLRRSRERLVTALEEERRRLQRDLHDGLGPTLAGALMKLEAARTRLDASPGEADRLLGELAADTRRTIEEVRRLTYDLRPPALDQLGLVGALRERAAEFSTARAEALDIGIESPIDLPPLPAAVEVAAYRIGLEALTNVARHSGASHAILRLAVVDGALDVEVVDDGCGIDAGGHIGVGHRSMRERAEELGGWLELGEAGTSGARVHARIPLRSANDG